MTTEFVLILGLYAFILLGAFLGDRGPHNTYFKSGPRLAAIIERDVSIGKRFINANTGGPTLNWADPDED